MSTTTPPTDLSVSTAAATALGTKCHLFKIEGYERIKIMYGNGKSLESGGFEAAGRAWKIQFFPNGNTEENAGYISLYLKLDEEEEAGSDAAGVMAEVMFALVGHHGAGSKPYSVSFTTTFTRDRMAVGYPKFIKREGLEKSEFLRDGCLAVRCDVAVLKQSVDAVEQAAQVSDMERLDMVCDCSDDACKRRHLRGGLWLRDAFARLFFGCFPN